MTMPASAAGDNLPGGAPLGRVTGPVPLPTIRTPHGELIASRADFPPVRIGRQAVVDRTQQVSRRHSPQGTAPTAQAAWHRTFPAAPEHIRDARRFLADLLHGHPAAGDAATCLSELAANAVLHSASARSGGTFRVRAALQQGTLRVEVEDDGGTWNPDTGPADQNGRGLILVSALTRQWGISQDSHGNRTVWFEMP
jgi:serine/threonine-protein kinase RsbW